MSSHDDRKPISAPGDQHHTKGAGFGVVGLDAPSRAAVRVHLPDVYIEAEPKFTMRPHPRPFIRGSSVWVTR